MTATEWRGFRAYNVSTGLGIDVNQLEAGLRQALAEVLRQQGNMVNGKAVGFKAEPGRCGAGRAGEIDLPAATYGPPRPGNMHSSFLDTKKIQRELDWRPQVTLEEGLKRTAA